MSFLLLCSSSIRLQNSRTTSNPPPTEPSTPTIDSNINIPAAVGEPAISAATQQPTKKQLPPHIKLRARRPISSCSSIEQASEYFSTLHALSLPISFAALL